MKYPDRFSIIDSRVIKKLGRSEWLRDYLKKPEIYEDYLILLRSIAKKENKLLRDVERAMFEQD